MWIASILILIGLFLNLGVQPLYLEEPRRAIISMEILENNNLLFPTQLGEPYLRKPPFFNWVLIFSTEIFGGFSEWALRLPTVLSVILLSLLSFLMGRRYMDFDFGWKAGLLFASSGGILFYFSTLAEIDLFYAAITTATIFSIYHFYEKRQFYLLFLVSYLLSAIGVLTKGLPSFLFLGISLLVFFTWKRSIKTLFTLPNFAGLGVFLLVLGGYFFGYSQNGSISDFISTLWGQSSERTVIETGFSTLLQHLVEFPLTTLLDMMPAGILLIFLVRKDFWKIIKENDFIHFLVLMILSNILIYWISPGSKQRYIYALYPFFLITFLYFFEKTKDKASLQMQIIRSLVFFILAISALGSLSLPFIPDLQFISYRWPLAIVSFLSFLFLGYSFLKNRKLPIVHLIIALSIGRIIFDLTVLPQRADQSGAQNDKKIAREIDQIVNDGELYIWNEKRISFTTIVYLNKFRDQTLRFSNEKSFQNFYITSLELLQEKHQVLYIFDYRGNQFGLIRFLPD